MALHTIAHTHTHTNIYTDTLVDVLVSVDDGVTGVFEGNSIGIKFNLPTASHQQLLLL